MRLAAILFFCLCGAAYCAPDTLRQSAGGENAEPAYKVFYENGFYREAIELLQTKVKERPDTVNVDYLAYLAFCYAAGGWRDSAIAVFHEILAFDSAFHLDTIATSPKILDVFAEADFLRRSRPASAIPPPPAHPEAALAPLPEKTETAEAPKAAQVTAGLPVQAEKPTTTTAGWDRYALYCMPGGAGQFYRGRPVSGAALLALQAAGIAAGYWAYDKRRGAFDPGYGWTNANKGLYEKYSTYSIGGFCIFLIAYSVSVIESFAGDRKNKQ